MIFNRRFCFNYSRQANADAQMKVPKIPGNSNASLGGGFQNLWFSPLLGETIPILTSRSFNVFVWFKHQLVNLVHFEGGNNKNLRIPKFCDRCTVRSIEAWCFIFPLFGQRWHWHDASVRSIWHPDADQGIWSSPRLERDLDLATAVCL